MIDAIAWITRDSGLGICIASSLLALFDESLFFVFYSDSSVHPCASLCLELEADLPVMPADFRLLMDGQTGSCDVCSKTLWLFQLK